MAISVPAGIKALTHQGPMHQPGHTALLCVYPLNWLKGGKPMPHVVIVTDRVHFTTVRQEMRRAVGGRYRS